MTEETGRQARFRERFDSGIEMGRQRGGDLLDSVRERPLVALGAVFGAGVLLALISARRGEEQPEEELLMDATADAETEPEDPEARAELWERRARRLQRLTRRQEEELRSLRAKRAAARGLDEDDSEEGDEPAGGIAELFRVGLQKIVRSAAAEN